ncbi:diheme cytochrome c [Aromatoleum petrolei]|uniref:Cytochrome C n=1 Tax=Aromatoleum petrolei TaxID=76116 RepID=A0ABX1MYW8_9RHOO|nr:diheme cytochrome c [Aromatoleum petrolei]NMF91496.1 cytochrome C [Aromatoleum petrolei]QTQ35597.1 Dihem cytochrome c domain-containing protein [Aromatoleum petrolei]
MKASFPARALRALALAAVACTTNAAFADDDEDKQMNINHPVFRSECGSCHIAFPPALLGATSWRTMMAGLDKHFGSDASLDAETAATITKFLVANAARRDTAGSDGRPLLRISDTGWFRKEHRDGHDGITPGIFRSEAVKSASNCAACHRNAADGDFSERDIRIPKNGARS